MNRVAVVSGGTKGIGRAIVFKLAMEGFDIATCARKEDDLKALKEEVEDLFPHVNIYVKRADLSDKSEVKAFAEFVLGHVKQVQILVNNTGFFLPGSIHEEPDGQLEQQINTNLYSAYYLTRAIIPNMIEKKCGHVFNMCSVASITAYPNGGSYCISKFALYGMSKVLREEMKPYGIRVTSILPGATMTASWDGVEVERERLMKPEDVAEALWSAFAMSKNSVVEDVVIRPQLGDL